jgi:hypothetical protein
MKIKYFLIIFFAILIIIILTFFRKDFVIIKAEVCKSDISSYSPNCYFYHDSKKLLIREKLVYKYMLLRELHNPSAESMIEYKFDFFENKYFNELKGYRILDYDEKQNIVVYNSQNYFIQSRIGDSIFVEAKDKNGYLIFIDKN